MFKKFMCKAGINMVMEEAGISRDLSLLIIGAIQNSFLKEMLKYTEALTPEDRDLVLAHFLMMRFEMSLRNQNKRLDLADQLATGIARVEDQLFTKRNLGQGPLINYAQSKIESAYS